MLKKLVWIALLFAFSCAKTPSSGVPIDLTIEVHHLGTANEANVGVVTPDRVLRVLDSKQNLQRFVSLEDKFPLFLTNNRSVLLQTSNGQLQFVDALTGSTPRDIPFLSPDVGYQAVFTMLRAGKNPPTFDVPDSMPRMIAAGPYYLDPVEYNTELRFWILFEDGTLLWYIQNRETGHIYPFPLSSLHTKLQNWNQPILWAKAIPQLSRFVIREPGTWSIWDAVSLEKIEQGPPDSEIKDFALSDSNKTIAAIKTDGSLVIWQRGQNENLVETYRWKPTETKLSFVNIKGHRLLSGAENGEAWVWNLDSHNEDLVCQRKLATSAPLVSGIIQIQDGVEEVIGLIQDKSSSSTFSGVRWKLEQNCFKEIMTYPGYKSMFSDDDSHVLLVNTDNTAQLRDTATGVPVATYHGHTGSINSIGFSPDGTQVLTTSTDRTARLWNAQSGHQEVFYGTGHMGSVLSVTFSPDKTKVLTGGTDKTARLWNAKTGVLIATYDGHTDSVHTVLFSPNGQQALTGTSKEIKQWDIASGMLMQTYNGHAGWIYSVRLSPDGSRLLTASNDQTAKVWNTTTGAVVVEYKGHTDSVFSAEFSRDGKRALTASADGTAQLWDTASGVRLKTYTGHTDWVQTARFSLDESQIVTASSDHTARRWDTALETTLTEYKGHTQPVTSVEFSPDGNHVLTGSLDQTAQLWSLAGVSEDTYDAGQQIRIATFSLDGKYIVTANPWRVGIQIWEVASGDRLATYANGSAIAFSSDSKQTLVGEERGATNLMDITSDTLLATYAGHTGQVRSASFSPDGKQVLTVDDHAWLWDASTGGLVVNQPKFSAASAEFSHDGKTILSIQPGSLSINDATSYDKIYQTSYEPMVFAAFFPYRSDVFAIDNKQRAYLWNNQGLRILNSNFHKDTISSVSFPRSPGMENQVLTTSQDGTARLWDSTTGRTIFLYQNLSQPSNLSSGMLSLDGNRLLVSTDAGQTRLLEKNNVPLKYIGGFTLPSVGKKE